MTIACGLDARVLAVYEAVGIVFAMWDHANLAVPERLDRLLRLIVVTLAMHHVHHSSRNAETDSNYDEVLSLWDRLFGTYRALPVAALRETCFGLDDAAGDPAFVGQLRAPFARRGAPPPRGSEA